MARRVRCVRLFVQQFDRALASGVDLTVENRRAAQIAHQPDPLARRLSPYLLIGPANLVRPIRNVCVAFCLNAHRNGSRHLARPDAVERRPVIAFAIHDAGGEWISADQPLRLLLCEVFIVDIAAQLCSHGERFRFRKQHAGVAAELEPYRISPQVHIAAQVQALFHLGNEHRAGSPFPAASMRDSRGEPRLR